MNVPVASSTPISSFSLLPDYDLVVLVALWNPLLDHELLKGRAFDLALYPLQAWPGAGSQQMLAEGRNK